MFQSYCILADIWLKISKKEHIADHLFLLLEWNLISRSGKCFRLQVNHISIFWEKCSFIFWNWRATRLGWSIKTHDICIRILSNHSYQFISQLSDTWCHTQTLFLVIVKFSRNTTNMIVSVISFMRSWKRTNMGFLPLKSRYNILELIPSRNMHQHMLHWM